MIFHQPRFPWNKEISLTKPPFGVRSCEVTIIWPEYSATEVSNKTSGRLFLGHNCWRPLQLIIVVVPFSIFSIDLMYFHKSWPKASKLHHRKLNFVERNPTYNGVVLKKPNIFPIPTHFNTKVQNISHRCTGDGIHTFSTSTSALVERIHKIIRLGIRWFWRKKLKNGSVEKKKNLTNWGWNFYFSWWKILDSCLFISYIHMPLQFQIHGVLADFWGFGIFSVVSALSFRCMHWWDHKIFRASLISQRSVGGYEVCWFRVLHDYPHSPGNKLKVIHTSIYLYRYVIFMFCTWNSFLLGRDTILSTTQK